MIYPTGPNRLSPRDIPGYEARGGSQEGGEENELDAWAWYRRDEAGQEYRFLEQGMERVAEAMKRGDGEGEGEAAAGGLIDGVVGFSQGGCMAGMLAAALETGREPAHGHEGWLRAVREANGGRPFKFAVIYSGFWAPPTDLGWLYEPKIRTPTLHYLGSLDTVVDETRSQGLVERCEGPLVLTHPGGHYVPVTKEVRQIRVLCASFQLFREPSGAVLLPKSSRHPPNRNLFADFGGQWAMPLAGFIKNCVEGAEAATKL